MSRRAWAALCLLAWAPLAAAADASAPALDAVKAATVMVHAHQSDGGPAGSGFLVERNPHSGYIITTDDVPASAPNLDVPQVDVVLGSGTAGERVLLGDVIAIDKSRMLALVRVDDDRLPAPIKLVAPPDPVETTSIYACGFPCGEIFTARNHQPEMTVTTGSITSLRRDERNQLVCFQVDCDLLFGNHGGPVVLADGSLIGMASLRVGSSRIGVVNPTQYLHHILRPAVDRLECTVTPGKGGDSACELTISARVSDPLHEATGVEFMLAPADPGTTSFPADDGSYAPVSAHMTMISPHGAGESLSATTSVTADRFGETWYFIQARLHASSGAVRLGRPIRVEVPASAASQPGDAAAGSAAATRSAKTGADWLGGAARVSRACRLPADLAPPSDLTETWPSTDVKGPPAIREFLLTLKVPEMPTSHTLGDGARLYLGYQDGSVRYFDLDLGAYRRQIRLPGAIAKLACTPCGIVAAIPDQQEVYVLDAETLAPIRRLMEGRFTAIATSPGWPYLAMSANDRSTAIFDLRTGLTISHLSLDRDGNIQPVATGHDRGEWAFEPAIAPDGRHAIACCGGNGVAYELAGGAFTRLSRSGFNQFRGVSFSGDSAYVALLQATEANDVHRGGGSQMLMYAVDNLTQAVLSIGSSSHALGFDLAHHRLLIGIIDSKCGVDVDGADGTVLSQERWPPRVGGAQSIEMARDGQHFLASCDCGFVWSQVPP